MLVMFGKSSNRPSMPILATMALISALFFSRTTVTIGFIQAAFAATACAAWMVGTTLSLGAASATGALVTIALTEGSAAALASRLCVVIPIPLSVLMIAEPTKAIIPHHAVTGLMRSPGMAFVRTRVPLETPIASVTIMLIQNRTVGSTWGIFSSPMLPFCQIPRQSHLYDVPNPPRNTDSRAADDTTPRVVP